MVINYNEFLSSWELQQNALIEMREERFSFIHKKYVTPSKALIFVGVVSSIVSVLSTFIVAMGAGVSPYALMDNKASDPVIKYSPDYHRRI